MKTHEKLKKCQQRIKLLETKIVKMKKQAGLDDKFKRCVRRSDPVMYKMVVDIILKELEKMQK